MTEDFITETIAIDKLKDHSRNYREHPDDQLEHIIESIKVNGFYRNVVIAQDNIILAGHGVVKAARKMGITEVPVRRLDITSDSLQALKVLAGDNEIAHLGEIDDRELSELLKEVNDLDLSGLLGTGFDEMMLANLVYVTRPASEIEDFDAAAHWVGMPEYEEGNETLKVVVSFKNEVNREEFLQRIEVTSIFHKTGSTWSIWYPPKEKEDMVSMRFENG